MTEIVDLDEHRPHISGPVVCTRCRHKWVAVRPVGVDLLECPACGASRGASLDTMLHKPHIMLGEECCGQRDANGTCMAPACIFGEALKMAQEAAARIERLEAALREIMGMDEVAIVEFKKGDGWLHQRVARAALEGRT